MDVFRGRRSRRSMRARDAGRGDDAGRMDLEFVVIYTGAALLLGGLAFMWIRVGPSDSAAGSDTPPDQPTTTVVVLAGTVADSGSGDDSADLMNEPARRVLVVGSAATEGEAQWEWQCPNGHVLTKKERNRSADADPGAHTRPPCR